MLSINKEQDYQDIKKNQKVFANGGDLDEAQRFLK